MASRARGLLRFLAVAFLAGLCASGSCTVFISSDRDCDDCDDCLDCGACGCCGCSDCGCCGCGCSCGCGCDDQAPPPRISAALVIEPDGTAHAGWLLVPSGAR